MRCAIYTRKSNEQTDAAEGQKSVERQAEHARAFADERGWQVLDEHVYEDDAVSGADFDEKRPGLMRLLNALGKRAPFDVLVISETVAARARAAGARLRDAPVGDERR